MASSKWNKLKNCIKALLCPRCKKIFKTPRVPAKCDHIFRGKRIENAFSCPMCPWPIKEPSLNAYKVNSAAENLRQLLAMRTNLRGGRGCNILKKSEK